MIVVIADDLSGAAEIANAALESGLSADVQLRFDPRSAADVICVTTSTRSLSPTAAAEVVEAVTRVIALAKPELIYKKCDSLLRGPVAAEAVAAARALGRARILLVPANPSRQRITLGGVYFADGVPLAESKIAADPEHPRRSSRVVDLLGDTAGIESPDTMSPEDVMRHARRVDGATLPVGGVDFFNAILAVRRRRTPVSVKVDVNAKPPVAEISAEGSSLFVCGSQIAWRSGRGDEAARRGVSVFVLPRELLVNNLKDDVLSSWTELAGMSLRHRGSALLALGQSDTIAGVPPARLAERMAKAAAFVLQRDSAAKIFIEGGATATAVVQRLKHQHFHAEVSPGAGVGALRPADDPSRLFLIKPGSYPWPDSIWRLVRR